MGLVDNSGNREEFIRNNKEDIQHVLYKEQFYDEPYEKPVILPTGSVQPIRNNVIDVQHVEEQDASNLTIADQELDMIRRSVIRNKGKRNRAARELGISERTLYRKIKQFNLESI